MKKLHTIRTVLILVCFALLLTLVVPPFFNAFINTIEPWVLGMPFMVFYVVLVNIIIAVILSVLWNIDKRISEAHKHD